MSATTALLLYFAFAAGGLGIYLMMPRAQRSTAAVGGLFGLAALTGLLALIGSRLSGEGGAGVYFYLFAAIAVAGAARVVTHPKPVYSAIYFVLVVIAVAALLVLLEAEFLAAALVIIYAGAILVTYLFVIMLAQQPGSPIYDRSAREPFAAVVAGFVLMGAVAGQAGAPNRVLASTGHAEPVAAGKRREASPARWASDERASEVPERASDVPEIPRFVQDDDRAQGDNEAQNDNRALGGTAAMGEIITTKYVVVLEVAGILLLVSMVGAIALSRKRVPSEVIRTPRPALGQIGKEVEPF